jgi:hypothetical protein
MGATATSSQGAAAPTPTRREVNPRVGAPPAERRFPRGLFAMIRDHKVVIDAADSRFEDLALVHRAGRVRPGRRSTTPPPLLFDHHQAHPAHHHRHLRAGARRHPARARSVPYTVFRTTWTPTPRWRSGAAQPSACASPVGHYIATGLLDAPRPTVVYDAGSEWVGQRTQARISGEYRSSRPGLSDLIVRISERLRSSCAASAHEETAQGQQKPRSSALHARWTMCRPRPHILRPLRAGHRARRPPAARIEARSPTRGAPSDFVNGFDVPPSSPRSTRGEGLAAGAPSRAPRHPTAPQPPAAARVFAISRPRAGLKAARRSTSKPELPMLPLFAAASSSLRPAPLQGSPPRSCRQALPQGRPRQGRAKASERSEPSPPTTGTATTTAMAREVDETPLDRTQEDVRSRT